MVLPVRLTERKGEKHRQEMRKIHFKSASVLIYVDRYFYGCTSTSSVLKIKENIRRKFS